MKRGMIRDATEYYLERLCAGMLAGYGLLETTVIQPMPLRCRALIPALDDTGGLRWPYTSITSVRVSTLSAG
jgi:hypothetical protein